MENVESKDYYLIVCNESGDPGDGPTMIGITDQESHRKCVYDMMLDDDAPDDVAAYRGLKHVASYRFRAQLTGETPTTFQAQCSAERVTERVEGDNRFAGDQDIAPLFEAGTDFVREYQTKQIKPLLRTFVEDVMGFDMAEEMPGIERL